MAAPVQASPTMPAVDSDTTPKAKSKSPPVRIDWASMQSGFSSEDTTVLDTESNQCRTPIRSTTPEPTSSKRKRSLSSNGSSLYPQEARTRTYKHTNNRIYDVPTLMRYRNSLVGLTVFAKIKPEALNENLFSHMMPGRNFISQPKTRGFSEISHRSRHSVTAPPPIFTDGPAVLIDKPTPLPSNYEEHHNVGRRDGFVRFLKQHASPPHNRVTAGGRIVPAGPNSPPPMFNFESLTGMAEQKRQALINGGPLSAPPGLTQGMANGWMRSRFTGLEDSVGPSRRYQNNLQALPSMLVHNLAQGSSLAHPAPQTAVSAFSTPLVPVGTFEDGSQISASNGLYFRTYWNGLGFVVEPLSMPSVSVSPVPPATPQQPHTASSIPVNSSHRVPSLDRSFPLGNSKNRSSQSFGVDQQVPKTAQFLDAQQRNLKEELHKLDRHLALNHYQLNQDQKNQFVSQRRSLIEEIDNIRRVREPSAPALPIIDVRELAKRAKTRNSKSRSDKQSSSMSDDFKCVAHSVHGQVRPKKALSPNAAPFVPSLNAQTPVVSGSPLLYGNTSSHQLFQKPPQSTPIVISPSVTDKKAHRPDDSLDRDPEDPAMRIIHNSDIAYASKYEHDVIDGRKKYCSKVYEFQEALRCVRQQARLYGCSGGSSKDPAYDAEQDIWWAICDNDPIPLPRDPPDHVVNPRPWDWNDSAFNHRCISKATRREAISLRSTSGAPAEAPPAKLRVQVAVHEPKAASSNLGKHVGQIEAANSSLSLRKSTRALREVKNPPGPKEISSQAQHKSDKAPIQPRDAPMQGQNTVPPLPSKPVSQGSQLDIPASGQTGKIVAPKGPKNHMVNINQAVRPGQGPETSSSREIDQDTNRKASGSSGVATSINSQPKSTSRRAGSHREKARGPKKTKSKQQLREGNSLRRHRQAVHQGQTAKRPSILNFEKDFKPASTHSSLDVRTYSEVSSEATQTSFLSRTSQQLSPRGAARKALQFYDRSRTKSPLKPQLNSTPPQAQRARVNLPALAHAHLKNKFKASTPPAGETRPVAPTTPSRDSFLRDMLRGARYSSKKVTPAKKTAEITTASTQTDTPQSPQTIMEGNKENAPAALPPKTVSAEPDCSSLLDQDVFMANKAPSSLAASSLQAIAFLPQFDGAGKARAAKIQQEHGVDASLARKAKVNLPQTSSCSAQAGSDNQTSDTKPVKSLTSSLFGLDGSNDDRPADASKKGSGQDAEAELQARLKKVAEYDTRGLTEEDYLSERTVEGGVKSAEHCRNVDRLIEKIEKEELEYIAKVKREQAEKI